MIETHIAIQGVCAWPNLQRLGDGTLIALIWNQPCHGKWQGDLDCWASTDDGWTWSFRGRAAAHEPGAARFNCAAGLASDGDVVVLCSGYDGMGPPGAPLEGRGRMLRPWVCRSSDGGHTWEAADNFPDPPADTRVKGEAYCPFGNILPAADGALCASGYLKKDKQRECFLFRSRDDGKTWGEPVMLNTEGNETAILHLGGGRWLAAGRNNLRGKGTHLELLASQDDGKSWRRTMRLSLAGQVTGHLARLDDGRVLLTYGVRNWGNYGVNVRFSADDGDSWGPPIRVADTPFADCGYPSTVQLPDGRAVTAYYTAVSHNFHYEMRIARWKPADFLTKGSPVTGR